MANNDTPENDEEQYHGSYQTEMQDAIGDLAESIQNELSPHVIKFGLACLHLGSSFVNLGDEWRKEDE